VYTGKAGSLKSGNHARPIGHWGERTIWQLADARDLQVSAGRIKGLLSCETIPDGGRMGWCG
jgi:hypothetical protein